MGKGRVDGMEGFCFVGNIGNISTEDKREFQINHSTLLWGMEGSCSVGTIGNISTEDNRECQINWQGAGISEKQFCTEQIQDFSTVYSM